MLQLFMKPITTLSLILVSSLIFSACGNSATNTSNTTSNTSASKQQQSSPKSLRDLLSLGVAQKCTWTSTQDGKESSGEVVVNGSKFKQTFSYKDPENGSVTENAISDGQWIYTWNNINPGVGTKINLSSFNQTPSEGPSQDSPVTTESKDDFDFDNQIDYKCSPTTITDSDFTLPSNIKFTDLTQMMQDLQKEFTNLDLDKFKDQ